MKLPVVACAICNKQVDMLESWEDLTMHATVFQAHCHGQTEAMFLFHSEIEGLSAQQLEEMLNSGGVAFRPILMPMDDAKTITNALRQSMPILSVPFAKREGL